MAISRFPREVTNFGIAKDLRKIAAGRSKNLTRNEAANQLLLAMCSFAATVDQILETEMIATEERNTDALWALGNRAAELQQADLQDLYQRIPVDSPLVAIMEDFMPRKSN